MKFSGPSFEIKQVTMEILHVIRNSVPLLFLFAVILYCSKPVESQKDSSLVSTLVKKDAIKDTIEAPAKKPDSIAFDTSFYNQKLLQLVHNKPSAKWPVKSEYPLAGAALPFKRIIAYYGNFLSPGMGILGKLPEEKLIEKLRGEIKKWEEADSLTPVLPAIHYIAVTAQASAGNDGKYRNRMPASEINKALRLAEKIDGIVFLDVQVGHSTLQQELPKLEKYLSLPNVHLGIDPEYSMKGGQVPCAVVGSFDAADINYASEYLASLVKENNLPPKILIVHRFTKGMVTNYQKIRTRPETQLVIHMDGFGFPDKKISSYKIAVVNEPVQFAGFKIFYKQDGKGLMKPDEILKLYPKPVYIQYQ